MFTEVIHFFAYTSKKHPEFCTQTHGNAKSMEIHAAVFFIYVVGCSKSNVSHLFKWNLQQTERAQ